MEALPSYGHKDGRPPNQYVSSKLSGAQARQHPHYQHIQGLGFSHGVTRSTAHLVY